MAPSLLCVSLVAVLAHIIFMAQGQTVTCRYADSILFNATCFRYNSTPVTWAEGKAFCDSMNGALAKVNSQDQVAAALKNANTNSDTWIGANDIDIEGTYIWDHDKSPATYSLRGLWALGLPSIIWPYDCALINKDMYTNYQVFVQSCTSLHGTLCMEIPLQTNNSTINSSAMPTNTTITKTTTSTATTGGITTTTITITMTAANATHTKITTLTSTSTTIPSSFAATTLTTSEAIAN